MLTLTLLTASLAGLPAAPLPQPSPLPPVGSQCTYEGVFPGGSERGQWTYVSEADGKYRITLSPPSLLNGIVASRTGGRPFSLVSYEYSGMQRRAGSLVRSHEMLEVTVSIDSADAPSVITTSVRIETVCPGFPRPVNPDEEWHCQERVTDTWSTAGGVLGEDSGTTTDRRELTLTYEKTEPFRLPSGEEVEAAVLIRRDESGGHERIWLDPEQPWCPLRVDRLKLDRVVGSDRLVGRSIAPTAREPSTGSSGNVTLGVWALGMLLALAGALILALGIGWLASRRQRQRDR